MFRGFKQRAIEHELMDDFSTGGSELREALQHLRMLNRIFGAAAPTLYGIQRLWMKADKPRRFSILDIGSGSGDVNRHILRWADENQIDLRITLVDITEEACEEARLLYRNEPRIEVMRSDLFELPEGCVDVITGTQFVHHFAANELPKVVESMLKASRLGVVINDIHRHWIPWAAVWLTARIVSNNRYILNDGPLSVAKGFRSEDWGNLRKALGISEMFYAWRPLFRYVVVIWKCKV
ncbi:methyltransferase domain-containing protein [Paenibacillus sp. LMG 31458]|uniref:Methyltransferase domain-containing protein n=1 Tax=Paenibacillus phytorum TaxID=2654977 RepID=A0ABX1Y6Z9_9BACL|nr:methyltransferase domain-containing protein [Paenibacillus phytorum]NOU75856.1 methyltransferase domain-containing protein [Paenibacillus phytorum]